MSIAASFLVALTSAGGVLAESPASASSKEIAPHYQIEVRGYLPPENTSQALPAYHEALKRCRVEGTVVLAGRIDARGRVRDLSVESGHPVLGHAARQAVGQWRYRPARLHGESVESHLTVTVHFRLAQPQGPDRAAVALLVRSEPLNARRN